MMVAKAITAKADFPKDLPAMLIRGEVTLGDVFGLDQESLYEIAKLGYGLLNSGNLREAKQIYEGLVAADPYDSVFHCHLGAVHHRLGEFDEALQQYSEALNFNYANVDALVGSAEIQLSRGNIAEAIQGLKRAIELDSEGTRSSTHDAHALLLAIKRAFDKHGSDPKHSQPATG
jgi:tetratricopeptide (TPR) repeat protein